MKCIIAAALVALVLVVAEGSAVPVAYYSPYSYPYAYPYAAYPYAYPAPAPVTVVSQEPRYTAVNLGAYHSAPLPGHTVSQTSVNVQPA